MTKEEILKEFNDINHVYNDCTKYDTLKRMLEELEQKPSRSENQNKWMAPDVLNHWIGAEVLDKIRAKLHTTAEMHEDGNFYLREECIDEIFNKCKAESEG